MVVMVAIGRRGALAGLEIWHGVSIVDEAVVGESVGRRRPSMWQGRRPRLSAGGMALGHDEGRWRWLTAGTAARGKRAGLFGGRHPTGEAVWKSMHGAEAERKWPRQGYEGVISTWEEAAAARYGWILWMMVKCAFVCCPRRTRQCRDEDDGGELCQSEDAG